MYGMHPEAEVVFEGVRVKVRTLELAAREGGGSHRREVVEAADAVVILPWVEDGRGLGFGFDGPGVVLIRNERFAVRETLWELPAGTVESGERPGDCAPRELVEETGYRAERLEKLTDFWPTPGFCTERLHAYLATGLEFVGQQLDATEKIEAVPMAWGEALGLIRKGELRDAKSIATMLFHETFGRGRGA